MRVLRRLLTVVDTLQTLLGASEGNTASKITVNDTWQVLGPFTIGTREAAWGADPLEAYGGFHALHEADKHLFTSSLTTNGTTTWSTAAVQVNSHYDKVDVSASVSFTSVDWSFLQQVYGWAALQWQGWARGQLSINSDHDELVNIYMSSILELCIDDQHYFGGDFYSFHRAPLTLRLAPGPHTIDVRLVRDVRSMGGVTDSPSIDISLSFRLSSSGLHHCSDVLFADRLDDWTGPLASTLATVILRNDDDDDVFITAVNTKHDICRAALVGAGPLRLIPGQSRPVAFRIDCSPGANASSFADLHFQYTLREHAQSYRVRLAARHPVPRSEPHVITYMHQGAIVSHAILRAPALHCAGNGTLPILLALHGAGVEVQSEMARHSLDDIADLCAWILMPSGSTSWSGDDWHNWGWADVQAAIDSIPIWIEQTKWKGAGVDTTRWLVTGHSNGGQGTWYAATHHPDNVVAASPISGYSSIQNYVPYLFWSPADPVRTAVIQAQLSGYRHELLLDNLQGIPSQQQHGAADDNVPAYHSRLLHDLLHQGGVQSSYTEFAGQPHWWEGVMTTKPLVDFYRRQMLAPKPILEDFSLVAANPGDTGSKGGLQILESEPGMIARIDVRRHQEVCHLYTTKVASFSIDMSQFLTCSQVCVDEQEIDLHRDSLSTLRKADSGEWQEQTVVDPCRRTPRQMGGLEAILRSNGTFQIVQYSHPTEIIASQVANNLLQYYNADAAVVGDYDTALQASGDIISIAVGSDLPESVSACPEQCTFQNLDGSIVVRRGKHVLEKLGTGPHAVVAAAFLRPLPGARLELVLWASDEASLRISTRLLPLLTGSGLPDFVLATRSMLRQGLQGVAALGFFDALWCPTDASVFP